MANPRSSYLHCLALKRQLILGMHVSHPFFFQRVLMECDSLREMNEEMKCSQFQNTGLGTAADLEQPMGNLEMLSLPPEVK